MSTKGRSGRRVFISYDNVLTRNGFEVADRLRGELRAAGFEVLMDDEEDSLGRPYPQEAIRDMVNRSDAMIALLGLSVSQPDRRREEHELAIKSGMPLLIVNINAVQPLPVHLSGRPWRRYPEELQSLLADLALDPPRVFRGPRDPHYNTIPKLPPNHVIRAKELGALRALVLDRENKTIGVTGAAGSGKTVLIAALCGDEEIRKAFPDGIGWITIGREWNGYSHTLKADIAAALGEDISGGHGRMSNEYSRACDAGYRTIMGELAALVVVDDVWRPDQVKDLLVDAPRSLFLFLTRDATLARSLANRTFDIAGMSSPEALELLALWSRQPASALPPEAEAMVRACAGVPGSLAQVGAHLREGSQSEWQDAAHRIESGPLSGLDSVAMNVASLDPEMRERYLRLAVLLEDMVAPPVVLQMLWQVDAEEARRTARYLVERSLAAREEPTGAIRLHDLQLDYARSRYPDQKALELIHGALRLSAETIKLRPEEFCSQLVGRLLPYQDIPAIAGLIGMVDSGMSQPWLRSLWPTLRWPPAEILRTLTIGEGGFLLTHVPCWAVFSIAGGTINMWDLETGQVVHRLQGDSESSFGFPVATNGRRVIGRLRDNRLKVWDLQSGEEQCTLAGHSQMVTSAAITADGRYALSGSWDHSAKLWDLGSGREVRTFSGHSDWVEDVAFAGDGQRALSTSHDGSIKLWDLNTGLELRVLRGERHETFRSLALTADGQTAVSGSSNGTVRVWDLTAGREVQRCKGSSDFIGDVAITPDGRYVVAVFGDGALEVWETKSGAKLRSLNAHRGQALRVSLTADGRRAAVSYVKGTVVVWDLEIEPRREKLERHSNFVDGLALIGDGRRVVSGSWDHTLKIWDLESGEVLRTIAAQQRLVVDVAATRDGRILSAGTDHTVKVWDASSGRELLKFTGHSNYMHAVAVTRDGRRAASLSEDKTLKIWEVDSGKELLKLGPLQGWCRSVAFTPDGSRIVFSWGAGSVKVWDIQGRRELHTLSGHTGIVRDLAITADSSRLLSASSDRSVKVWDLARGEEVQTLAGHAGDVATVAVSPDGRLAASGSQQDGLKVWDLETGHTLAGFTCEGGPLSCVFSGPNEIVAGDTTGRVYRLQTVL